MINMHVYLNERRTDIKIITDGSQLFIIPNPPEDPTFIKETEKTGKTKFCCCKIKNFASS